MSKRKKYPFPGLTTRQKLIVSELALGGQPYISKVQEEKLIAKGLILKAGERIICQDRFGTVKAPVYDMSTWAHIAWCEWAGQGEEAEGAT